MQAGGAEGAPLTLSSLATMFAANSSTPLTTADLQKYQSAGLNLANFPSLPSVRAATDKFSPQLPLVGVRKSPCRCSTPLRGSGVNAAERPCTLRCLQSGLAWSLVPRVHGVTTLVVAMCTAAAFCCRGAAPGNALTPPASCA